VSLLAALLLVARPACAAPKPEPELIGSLVRSERWNVRRGAHKVEEFSGNVRYRREGRSLRADWALYDHATKKLEARGDVVGEEALEDGAVATVRGDHGSHDVESRRGVLFPAKGGKVFFSRRAANGQTDSGSADRLEWDEKTGLVVMDGHVECHGPEGDAWGRHGVYDVRAGTLAIDGGRPVLRGVQPGWSAAAQADVLRARREPREVEGEGATKGWVRFEKGLPEKKR
jgi:lipopolysaccharide export system protein LptA